ncbi:hypothetical protein ASG90_06100 [Nocardioides sp. Soil797]|nr:hypothetical protein ASG90_06100 [Nocardioides sp. Soil797]
MGPLDRAVARRDRARQDSAVDVARTKGWRVESGELLVGRVFDQRFAAERATPVACDLVIDGGPEGFVAESWRVDARNLGSPIRLAGRQHLLRVPCPGTPRFLVKGVPRRSELRLFPRAFKDQTGFFKAPMMMVVAGEFAEVHGRIAPLLEAISTSRGWVIGLDDELVLMSSSEPDGALLELRLGLARAVVTALG